MTAIVPGIRDACGLVTQCLCPRAAIGQPAPMLDIRTLFQILGATDILLHRADSALCQAKDQGRNRVVA